MKRNLILLLWALLFTIGMSAQNKPLSLKLDGVSVKSAMEALSEQSGYTFFYKVGEVDTSKSVSINATRIEEAIGQILAGQDDVAYEIQGNTIVVSKKAPQAPKSQKAHASGGQVEGNVYDSQNNPLVGVVVMTTDGAHAVTTDTKGHFAIAAKKDTVLEFSCLGYATRTEKVGTRTNMRIVLADDVQQMEAVVVVGYGTQKKVNLTGSVSMVNSEDLEARPISNVANGLQGILPGVTVTSASAQPGESNATIRVRGVGTLGNSNPLILIDGVEGDISVLNPEDIESVSVLKDAASASIYGARGANGVLLVTTKKLGSGEKIRPSVTFNSYVGVQTPTRLPEMCDAIEFMTLDNEARSNIGNAIAWLDDAFDKVRTGSDPNNFANTDWLGAVLKPSAMQQNYGLSINGSMGDSGYMLSYRFFDQDGLTVGSTTGEQRHNLRYKMDTKLLDKLTLSSNVGYTARNIVAPINSLVSGGGAIYTAMRIAPNAPIYYTDGTWAYGGGNTNPVATLTDGGYSKTSAEEVSVLEVLRYDINKSWNVSATYNLTSTNSLRDILKKTIRFVHPDSGRVVEVNAPNQVKNIDVRAQQQTFILQSNFDFSVGNHNISGVVGMSQEWYVYRSFDASRNNLVTEFNPTINLGDASTMSNNASAKQWAIRSGFGRLSYNYDERYLFEMNMRYDLSSRFHRDNRAGLFPSFSAGWRVSEEEFMASTDEWLDNLKLRASWGRLGNQYVGSSNTPYLSNLTAYTDDISLIGGGATTGYTQSVLSNPLLTWETITMTDFGFDLTMFKNRFSLSFDWFTKDTDGILLKLNYPAQIGATPSEENAGKMNNTGWEIDMAWRDKVGEVRYGFGFNLSDVKNKITDLAGNAPDLSGDQVRVVGLPIDAFYGYEAIGLMTPEDFKIYDPKTGQAALPNIPIVLGNAYQPGDIKYRDISGPNGKPDGRITPEYDKKYIGSNIPRYTYSFRGDVAWRGFDFSFNLQGVGKCDGYLKGSARHALQDMAAYPQKVHLERYHYLNNPNPNTTYPRLTYNTKFNQETFSTFWLEDASYLRLKNIQLGYTLPSAITKKAKVDKCRIYISADNLLTVSDFFYAYDPETPVSSGGYYPQVKTCVLGVSITFR